MPVFFPEPIRVLVFEIELEKTCKGCRVTRPARIAQLVTALDLKTRGCGSIPWLVNLTIINCLSDETLNRGPV